MKRRIGGKVIITKDPKHNIQKIFDFPGAGFLTAAAAVILLAWGAVEVSDMFAEKNTQNFDHRMFYVLANPDYFSHVSAPGWLRSAVRDITSLGGFTVLTIVVIIWGGYFVLKQNYAPAVLLLAVHTVAALLCNFLKVLFSRPRPEIDQTIHVVSYSFPSGHAMQSAAVYLTLAILLLRGQTRRKIKIYFLGVSAALTTMVGLSRVCLGVHYPTDVLAGWLGGILWAFLCLLAARHLRENS